MISNKEKLFRKEDYNYGTEVDPTTIGYEVGKKFDDNGLPDTYNDQDPIDDNRRDGRGLPANFALGPVAETQLVDPEKLRLPENNLHQDVGALAISEEVINSEK